MATIWYHRTGTGELVPLVQSVGRSVVAGGLAAVAGWRVVSWVSGDIAEAGFWQSLGSLAVGALVVAVVFLAAAKLLKSPELEGLMRSRQRANS
jgi:peptidoglycan biosynthesis protein MviN/MurJ (putative lipid II flippase)